MDLWNVIAYRVHCTANKPSSNSTAKKNMSEHKYNSSLGAFSAQNFTQSSALVCEYIFFIVPHRNMPIFMLMYVCVCVCVLCIQRNHYKCISNARLIPTHKANEERERESEQHGIQKMVLLFFPSSFWQTIAERRAERHKKKIYRKKYQAKQIWWHFFSFVRSILATRREFVRASVR